MYFVNFEFLGFGALNANHYENNGIDFLPVITFHCI
jgi:hypothetical protein